MRRTWAAGDLPGRLEARERRQGGVHGGHVALHDLVALLAVALGDRLLDQLDRGVLGEHSGQGEEAHLHHGVDAAAEAGVPRQGARVDHRALELLVDDRLLYLPRQVSPELVLGVRAVQQERRAFACGGEDVVALEQLELVTGDEIRVLDQIRRVYRLRAEAEV